MKRRRGLFGFAIAGVRFVNTKCNGTLLVPIPTVTCSMAGYGMKMDELIDTLFSVKIGTRGEMIEKLIDRDVSELLSS